MAKQQITIERKADKIVWGLHHIPIKPNEQYAYSIIDKIIFIAEGNTVRAYTGNKETARYEFKNGEILRVYSSNGFAKIVYKHIDKNGNNEYFQGKLLPNCYPDELVALHRTDAEGHLIDFMSEEEKEAFNIMKAEEDKRKKEEEKTEAETSETADKKAKSKKAKKEKADKKKVGKEDTVKTVEEDENKSSESETSAE